MAAVHINMNTVWVQFALMWVISAWVMFLGNLKTNPLQRNVYNISSKNTVHTLLLSLLLHDDDDDEMVMYRVWS